MTRAKSCIRDKVKNIWKKEEKGVREKELRRKKSRQKRKAKENKKNI